jgi:hypothetical protein
MKKHVIPSIVVSLFFVLFSPAQASPSQKEDANVNLNPDQGYPGQSFEVTAYPFDPGKEYTVSFEFHPEVSEKGVVDEKGYVDTRMQVPNCAPGPYQIIVYSSYNGQRQVGYNTFLVLAPPTPTKTKTLVPTRTSTHPPAPADTFTPTLTRTSIHPLIPTSTFTPTITQTPIILPTITWTITPSNTETSTHEKGDMPMPLPVTAGNTETLTSAPSESIQKEPVNAGKEDQQDASSSQGMIQLLYVSTILGVVNTILLFILVLLVVVKNSGR